MGLSTDQSLLSGTTEISGVVLMYDTTGDTHQAITGTIANSGITYSNGLSIINGVIIDSTQATSLKIRSIGF